MEEPRSKQQKPDASLNTKYGAQHPRQQTLTNAIGSMICADAIPTSIVRRRGFQNLVEKFDPRYTLPDRTTFSRKVIPELKSAVHAHQMKRIQQLIKNESSMAFSTDGLDGRDQSPTK